MLRFTPDSPLYAGERNNQPATGYSEYAGVLRMHEADRRAPNRAEPATGGRARPPLHRHRGQHPALGDSAASHAGGPRPPRRAAARGHHRPAATSSRRWATRSAPPSPRPRRCGGPGRPAGAPGRGFGDGRAEGAHGAAYRRGEARDGDYFGPPLNRVRAAAGDSATAARCCSRRRRATWCRTSCRQRRTPARPGRAPAEGPERPEQVFQLLHPDLPADFPPLRSLDALPTTCRASSPASSGASRRWPRSKRLLAHHRAADAHRAGRRRQDPPGAAGRRPSCWTSYPGRRLAGRAGARWPTRRWSPQTVAAALGVREEPGASAHRDARRLPAPTAAAAASSTTASTCCDACAAAGRGAAARLPAPADPGHQPRAAGHRRRDDLARAVAVAARTRRQRPTAERRSRSPTRCGCSSSGRRPSLPELRRRRDDERGGGGADLPAAGRHPAGDRAGGGAGEGAAAWSRSPRGWTTASGC